jgi:hypothetical protein
LSVDFGHHSSFGFHGFVEFDATAAGELELVVLGYCYPVLLEDARLVEEWARTKTR